jgi:hypothetical protein
VLEPPGARRVKLIAAVLWREPAVLDAARRAMTRRWGPADFEGADYPFDVTSYYDPEMGPGLKRRLISFDRLIAPDTITTFKLDAAAIESEYAVGGKRRVNIDVGYLDPHKLVLVSFKYGAMKLYLGSGVWGDIVCLYRKGRFLPREWTFVDFRDGRYAKELMAIRDRYKHRLRRRRR